MNFKDWLEEQKDQANKAHAALSILVPTPDTIWGDIPADQIDDPNDATLRIIWERSRKDDIRFQQVIGPIGRKMEMVFLVRASAWLHEARKVDGLLKQEFALADIAVATNTDQDTAERAASYRLLTCETGEAIDKFRVTRAAKAMKGIEIIAELEGFALDLASAGTLLHRLRSESRDSLCKLVDGHVKVISSDEEPTRPPVAKAPSIVPDLLADYAVLRRIELEPDALPEADLHLFAVVRDGEEFMLKGPICSGDRARTLIQTAG